MPPLMRWLWVCALAVSARAEVKLSAVLADHMVVQRDRPVHVWGDAEPTEAVEVSFRGQARRVTTDELGRWSVYLPPGEAGGPFELAVRGSNAIVLHDVLVGDVWVAGGQSNMELALKNGVEPAREIAAADGPTIRLLKIKPRPADHPCDRLGAGDVEGWAPCRPESAAGFSAVAYHFAREVQARTHVPVGIVEACWGGTPAEAWTSLRTIARDPALYPVFEYRAEAGEARENYLRGQALAQRAYDRAVAEGRAGGLTDPAQMWHPNYEAWAPGALYNGTIAPLTPMAIRGAIWYQGESNSEAGQHPVYQRLFETLIADWRRAWGVGDFPFLYVQIANFARPLPEWHWPEVREAQRRALRVANTAMVVTIDVGEAAEIHPKNKREVGRRLALAARALVYGEKVEYSGPLFQQAVPEGSGMRLIFTHAAGLVARGGKLEGFEVAGADGRFVPGVGTIEGETVLAYAPGVTSPVYVRYGWAADPGCSLYNGAGLPATPFTTVE